MPGSTLSANEQTTMGAAFRRVAESRPGQEAMVCGETRLTYGQLLERVAALAHGLGRLGLGKGERIALLLPPGPEFVTLFFAIAELGAIVVPLSPQSRRRSLQAVLGHAEPFALVTARALQEGVLDACRDCRVIHVDEPGEDTWTLSGLIATGGSAALSSVAPQDVLALLYTSGTTGTPKGTIHSHQTLIAPVRASIRLRELWTRRPTLKTVGQMAKALARYRERLLRAAGRPQTFLSTTSWHTITGLEVMLQALLMGDRLVVMSRFSPREAMELVERERVSVLVAVPMAYQVMLRMRTFDQYDTSSLLICGTGSAPCPPSLAREMRRRFGCAVHIGFGATETGGGIAATSLSDSDDRQAETVGRPMPGMEIKVVDEQRRELPAGQVGELVCRSDSVMLGYYRAPEVTAEVIDEERWYYTGDLARIDERGYLHIVGRKKDVIIRGGQNVYPAEIETYLVAHPGIQEAAVVGVPAPVGGESVWAFVRLEEGAELEERQVVDYCRAELESFKVPSQVRFVADLPRTQTGKPQKYRLREMAAGEANDVEDTEGGS
jgi:acyl-CoA synthetase (AMP-forming)/AMP-acid ligase II